MPLARHDVRTLYSNHVMVVSTHMPLARHDIWTVWRRIHYSKFLLTCLLRGMTTTGIVTIALRKVSTHMPLARHDPFSRHPSPVHLLFLLTCLLRGMTEISVLHTPTDRFLLTCLLRGMTNTRMQSKISLQVSTHMPLARHDKSGEELTALMDGFYSHASCEA